MTRRKLIEQMLPSKVKNIAGMKFGMLTATQFIETTINGAWWECICECGVVKKFKVGSLTSGNSKSCGCRTKAALKAANTTHGFSRTPTHKCWRNMVMRCTNPSNKAYSHYGGRGISVCESWLTFENFLADMGPKPDGMTLDRINNNADYEPSNCKWATVKDQVRNRRMTIMYEGKPLAQIAEETGENYFTIYSRFKKHGTPYK